MADEPLGPERYALTSNQASRAPTWYVRQDLFDRLTAEHERLERDLTTWRADHESIGEQLADARKEVVAERTVRETCARVADQLQIVLDAHRRFHGKVGCPGLIDGCYVCQAEQSIGPTPTEPATDG